MQRQFVESSMLRSVGYDRDTQTLEVEFQHGGIYHYFDVEEDTYKELLEAESIGHYFNECIRDQYDDVRVR